MGKKRIKPTEENQTKRPLAKSGKAQGRLSDMGTASLLEAEKREKKSVKEFTTLEKTIKEEVKEEKKAVKKKKAKTRSRRYRQLRTKIDRKKLYPVEEAIKLICQLASSKIDETVEIHLVSREHKLSGSAQLPYSTGKSQKAVIADDQIIDAVSKGKIDFDILISKPEFMPKLAKVAKILGPKGLMPNPKTGTITDKPEELKKKLEAGETRFKTENKAPLIHFCLGKISSGEKKLLANTNAFLEAVKKRNIKKAVLTSTHSPGIKLLIE